jgi:hypothetical protein
LQLTVFGYLQLKDAESKLLWQTEIGGMSTIKLTDNGTWVGYLHNTTTPIWSLDLVTNAKFHGWSVYAQPLISCDDCFPCSLNVTAKPLYHLATNRCIPVSSTDSTCRDFVYDRRTSFYIPLDESNQPMSSTCLGNTTEILGTCDTSKAWRHYNDNFLTLSNLPDACLGSNFTFTSCMANGLRVDKLWSHGVAQISELSTARGSNRILLQGHLLKSQGNTLQVLMNGDLMYTNKFGRFKFFRTGVPSFKGPALLELMTTGQLVVTNLYGNVTLATHSKMTGTAPFNLTGDTMGNMVLMDAKGLTLFKLQV